LYQIKATVRGSTTKDRAANATDALRIFRKAQTLPSLRSCTVLRKGVIISAAELESDARGEQR
jgi:hypothetical protein